MHNVTAPKGKSKETITITVKAVGFGRGMPVPPSRKHRDKKAYAKRNACRSKSRRQSQDW